VKSVETGYNFSNAIGAPIEIRSVTQFDCTLTIQNNNARVGFSSCDESQLEYEKLAGSVYPPGIPFDPTLKREKRVHTDYDPNYGYVTGRKTAIGAGSTIDDSSNEVTVLTRTGFSTDNTDTWIVGHADKETVTSTMPARSDPNTPVLSATRTTSYNYDGATGALKWFEVEPDFGGTGVFLRKTTYSRNPQGQVDTTTVSTKDGHDRITSVVYGSAGDVFPTSTSISGVSPNCSSSSAVGGECAAAQSVTTTYHSGLGLLMKSVDANGSTAARQYDGFGRLRTEQRADGGTASFQYTSGTSPWVVVSGENGRQRREFYDERGLLTSVEEMDDTGEWFTAAQIEHEPHGWVIKRIGPDDASQMVASYSHDPLGRLTKQIGPVGETTWSYSGNTTTRTRKGASVGAAGKTIDQVDSSTEDQAGRVVSRVESVGAMPTKPGATSGTAHDITTKYVYGPFGQLRDVVDTTQKKVIHNEYDEAGRRWKIQDPDTGDRTFEFDGFDAEISTTANGKSQAWSYDVLGRRITETTTEGASAFVWDVAPNGIGRLASTTSALDGVVVAYEYDQQALLSAETRTISGQAYRVDLGHDEWGRPSSITYPDAAGSRYSVKYGYNEASGMLQSVANGAGSSLWQAKTRNHSWQMTREEYGDGTGADRTYHPGSGLPWMMSVSGGQGIGQAVSLALDYDVRGYLSQRVNYLTGETETFTHDELGRLTHWAGNNGGAWSVHYDYDDIGNMSSQESDFADGRILKKTFTSGPNTDGGVWGGPHAVTKVHLEDTSANQGGTASSDLYYNYDPLGRQIQSGSSRTLTYTDFDLPRKIVDGATTWNFQYDATHQRALKSDTEGRSTVYVGKLYEKRTAASGTVTHVMYVSGDGGAVVAQVTQAESGGSPVVDYLHGYVGATQRRYEPAIPRESWFYRTGARRGWA
jgi:YD repeat-containing protein